MKTNLSIHNLLVIMIVIIILGFAAELIFFPWKTGEAPVKKELKSNVIEYGNRYIITCNVPDISEEKIETVYKEGVLTITIPKTDKRSP